MSKNFFKNYFEFIESIVASAEIFDKQQQLELVASTSIILFEEIILQAEGAGIDTTKLREKLTSDKIHPEDKRKSIKKFIAELPESKSVEIIPTALDQSIMRMIETIEKNRELDKKFWDNFQKNFEQLLKKRKKLAQLKGESKVGDKLKQLSN